MKICILGLVSVLTLLPNLSFFKARGLGVAQAGPSEEITQRVREVELYRPKKIVHTVDVTGAPNLKTRIKLNDSFTAKHVLCGVSCSIEVATDAADLQGPVDWMMEVRPDEQSIIVWPARLPDIHRGPERFTTNVQLMADGGHLINITLRLVRPRPGGQGWEPADAVVALHLPDAATKAHQGLAEPNPSAGREVQQAQWLERLLAGAVHCRTLTGYVHRIDQVRLRALQACTSTGEPQLAWVVFTLENRGTQALSLAHAELAPASDQGDAGFTDLSKLPAVAPSGCVQAVTYKHLSRTEALSGVWRVRVVPASLGHRPIEVGPFSFSSH